MATLVVNNCAEVFVPHSEYKVHLCRTDSTLRESKVLQRNESSESDGEILHFPGPLMGATLQKDKLMRFIQEKRQECLLDLDESDQQKSYFFWSIMELFCNRNGRVMMAEIGTLLFKGYGLMRRKLLQSREDWCLPLAKLLCSSAPDQEHREAIVQMGHEFAFKQWTYAAQICYVVAQIELGACQEFILIGCDSFPEDCSLQREAIERTEVYEYVLSLTSGFGQPFFQDFKFYHCYKLAISGHRAQALKYCETITAELHQNSFLKEELTKLSAILRQSTPEDTEVLKKRFLQLNNSAQPERNTFDHDDLNSRYTMGEMLGEGSFGSVYGAVRISDGKEVAIKCAAKDYQDVFITIPGETRSLPVEVALLEMVSKAPDCEKVVKMLEWFETSTSYILVLERPNPCMDLFNFCESKNFRLSEAMVRKIMVQVVEAARYCCDRGVLHRDIKTENILINPNTLEIKLIDFGCGELLHDELYTDYAGTPAFWPPEWIIYNKYHGVPATIWSLGILLFYILTGVYPFDSDEEAVNGDLPLSDKISKECCALIMWCLERDPENRPTFEEILNSEWIKAGHQEV